MGVKVGELFVNLGITGAGKAVDALGSVGKGLGSLKDASLEVKAGLLALLYGFEKLTSQSLAMGNSLTNLSTLTGKLPQDLQKYEVAAKLAGVAGEDAASSIKSIQKAMFDMSAGKGAPEGLGFLETAVGFDPAKARDMFYVIDKLQQFAKVAPPDVAQWVTKSFGVTEGMLIAMKRGAFTQERLGEASKFTFSNKEDEALARGQREFTKLGLIVEKAFGDLTAKHGVQIIHQLTEMTAQVVKFTDALVTLANNLKIFKAITMVFEGWADIFKLINEGVDGMKNAIKGTDTGVKLPFMQPQNNIGQNMLKGNFEPLLNKPSIGTTGTNITVNQGGLHFSHDGTDHQQVARSHRQAASHAFRQTKAIAGGT